MFACQVEKERERERGKGREMRERERERGEEEEGWWFHVRESLEKERKDRGRETDR